MFRVELLKLYIVKIPITNMVNNKIKSELDMNVDTNEFIGVLKAKYLKLPSTTIRLLPFDKYVDLVLRQEELKRIDRHSEVFA